MIEINDVRFTYRDGKQLNFGSFKVDQGQHTLVLGQSGSGKTTLLHLLGGLLRGFTGRIQVGDTELSKLSDTALDRFRGRHMGFVFQKLHLLKSLNVRQNLKVSSWLSGTSASADREQQVLSQLGLLDKLHAAVGELSHGQAQRVAIARAVINKPLFILADEPTSALDDKNCQEVVNLLQSAANENNATLLIATHDVRLKSVISNTIQIGA